MKKNKKTAWPCYKKFLSHEDKYIFQNLVFMFVNRSKAVGKWIVKNVF